MPLGRIGGAGGQADERGLAGAGGPHDAESRARRDITGDVVQDGPVWSIGERHVAERDGPAGAPDGSGVRPLGHLGLLVEQRNARSALAGADWIPAALLLIVLRGSYSLSGDLSGIHRRPAGRTPAASWRKPKQRPD